MNKESTAGRVVRTRRRGRGRSDDVSTIDDGEDFFLFFFFFAAAAGGGGDADTGGEGRTGVGTDQEGARGVSRRERRVLRGGGVRDGRWETDGDGGGDVCEVERGVRAGVSGVLGGAL